jgi:hypothetical protein
MDTVTTGNNSTATVSLDRPSLGGPVVVELICSTGFASVPAQVTILQNQLSANFTVTTPAVQVPFRTALARIYATYAGNIASAMLTVKPSVIAGILNNLLVRPATVTAGGTIHGTVSLIEAVPTPTLVGLRAVEPPPSGPPPRNPPDAHYFPTDSQHHQEGLGGEPSSGPGPHLPLLWPSSSLVSVPSSITIPAGSTMAYFNITTAHNIAAGSRRLVTIIANAVGSRYAALTVVS